MRISTIIDDTSQYYGDIKGKPNCIGHNYHEVLIKHLHFEINTLFDYYSSKLSFNCFVNLREIIPKIRENVMKKQSRSKPTIILSGQ